MHKLLSANISRLCGSKAIRITVLLMLCMEGTLCMLLLNQDSSRVDLAMYVSIQGIGILISVALSVFYGTEYSDGTLRNKLIAGHERSSIYLASFITGGLSVTVIYVIWILVGAVFAVIMHIPVTISMQLAAAGIVGWIACLSYISIYNLIGMLSTSKAKTSIVCILSAFVLMFGGLTCYSLARPGLFSETKQMIFQLLFDVDPYGQIFQFMTADMSTLWKLGIYSMMLIAGLNFLGIYIFKRKDIK